MNNTSPPQAIDVVCGMAVDAQSAADSTQYAGKTYYFCCASCMEKFKKDPRKYLSKETKPDSESLSVEGPGKALHQRPGKALPGRLTVRPSPSGAESGTYTCPMHPEVRREGPGACPICGMALEPMDIPATEAPDSEYLAMRRRFWVSLVLTLPVFIISMVPHLFVLTMGPHSTPEAMPQHIGSSALGNWLQFLLATPVVLWGGAPFFQRGARSLVGLRLNMFTLIAIGTGVAYAYSIVATVWPGAFPASFHSPTGEVAVYFEAAAVITTLVLLGQVLELRARRATGHAIRALLGLAPKTARLIQADGSERDVPLADVRVGDRLRARPGEKVPVDGVVVDGAASVDESMITGESVPVAKKPLDKVIGGTIIESGSIIIEARGVGSDTLLARIVQMVAQAQRSRAPIQRLADVVAGYFVPGVLAAAAITFVIWAAVGPQPRMAQALLAAVAVLIIACPCALGLATPMSVMVGVGRGAREGVLIRSAEALEIMEKVDAVIVDKTGTLTEGRPRLTGVEPAPGVDADEVLRLAAGLEQGSAHPLASAITQAAGDKSLAPVRAENFESIAGQGVSGIVEGRQVLLGNPAMLTQRGVDCAPLAQRAEQLRQDGQTVVFLAAGGKAIGLLAVADPIKASTREALQLLRQAGVRLVLASGDNATTAGAVARQLGLDEVHAGVLPQDKGQIVRQLKEQGHTVAMAGDGVNDAPALAAADVGIAMGAGADVAMETAGITLVKGDLRGIARARRLSRATMRNIRQNLLLAFLYNTLCIPIAAGALYPLTGMLLSPMIAAAAMSLSSVSVISNALRLRRAKL